MFGKMMVAGLAVVGLVVACGPADTLNKNEGASCGANEDCGGSEICQPIQGREGDFCCPTPACSSSKENCQAAGSTSTGCTGVAIP